LLQDLIALLDGTHTVDEIVHALTHFDESQVLDSLQRLYEARVLEDGAPVIAPLSEDQQQYYASQLTFFSQFTNDPYSFQAKMAQSRVAVLGVGSIGSLLLGSLAESGVGQLVAVDFEEERSVKAKNELRRQEYTSRNPWTRYREITLLDRSPRLIAELAKESQVVVLTLDQQNLDLMERVNEACIQTSTVWLPVGIRAWEGYIGPTVLPRQTACYKCYDLRMKANLTHYEAYLVYERHLRAGNKPCLFGSLAEFGRIVADIAAIEITKLLTNFSPPTTPGRIFTIDFLSLAAEFHDVLKLPRCPACGEPSRQIPMMKPWSE